MAIGAQHGNYFLEPGPYPEGWCSLQSPNFRKSRLLALWPLYVLYTLILEV